MDGNRGKALLGSVLVCALLAPAPAAHAGASSAVFSTTCPGADAMPTAADRTQARLATTCLLNRIRSAAGVPQLRTIRVLRRIAAEHSRDMVTRHYFDHTGPGHQTLMRRLASIRWHAAAGENLGFGSFYYATPRAMVWGWMRSPGHRANILDPEFRYVGVAIALGAPESLSGPAATYTADFGGR